MFLPTGEAGAACTGSSERSFWAWARRIGRVRASQFCPSGDAARTVATLFPRLAGETSTTLATPSRHARSALTFSLHKHTHTQNTIVLASTVAWAGAYAATCALSHALSRTYRSLPSPAARAGWDTRVVSTLHAVLIVALALAGGVDLITDPAHATTLLSLRASPLTTAALGVSAGYFLVDLFLVVRHPGLGGPAMAAHHCAALAALAVGGTRDEGHLWTLALMLAEATTPLVNARYFLDAVGLRSHALYILNGLALTASWFVVRVAGFAAFFWALWTHRADVAALSPLCRGLLSTVPVLFGGLNLYWFALLLRGVAKVLGGGGGKKQQRVGNRPVKAADAAPQVVVAAAVAAASQPARRSPSPPRRVSFSDSPPARTPLTRARGAAPKPSALVGGGRASPPVGGAAPHHHREVEEGGGWRWWAASLPGRLTEAWA
jgi:hypothetical protein